MSAATKPLPHLNPIPSPRTHPYHQAIASIRDIIRADNGEAARYRAAAKRAKDDNESEEVQNEANGQAEIFEWRAKILQAKVDAAMASIKPQSPQ